MLARLLCIDFAAPALENGCPTGVGVADVATAAARSGPVRPAAAWLAECAHRRALERPWWPGVDMATDALEAGPRAALEGRLGSAAR